MFLNNAVMRIEAATGRCPECAGTLVTEGAATPWCGECEWNLGTFDPPGHSRTGWTWLDRMSHRIAFRGNRRQFDMFVTRPPRVRGWSPARVALLVASAVLLAATITLAWLGVQLLTAYLSPVTILPGLLLVCLAVLLRPRIGRLGDDNDVLSQDDSPALWHLVGQVADVLGAPRPHLLVVDERFNAAAGVYGIRRRRVLSIGLPLLAVLNPQERVALLAHELGHFVNGDPAQGLLTQPALRTFGELALVLRADRWHGVTATERVAMMLFRPVLRLASGLALACHIGLLWLGMRDHQRAEYAADAAAARVAGTQATASMLDDLVLAESIAAGVRTTEIRARTLQGSHAGVDGWQQAAAGVRAEKTVRMPVLRQHSIRAGADLFSSHPPAGMRAGMVRAWPSLPATVVLSGDKSAAIDAELRRRYDRAGRTLADVR